MFEWSFIASSEIFAIVTTLNLALGIYKKLAKFALVSIALCELVALANVGLAIFAVGGGLSARTSTIEYFFYVGCALLVPLAAITWTLIQRSERGSFVYAIAAVTLLVMVFRMHQIWFGV